jgi:transposase-like protein
MMTKRKLSPHARQTQTAERLLRGETLEAIAAALGVMPDTVHHDLKTLRAKAGRRAPWGEPADCEAAFIEEAQHVLQKTRAVQSTLKPDSTAYHNFVKLEWTILVKFIELNRKQTLSQPKEPDDDHPFAQYTNDELSEMARELGIDPDRVEALGRLDPGEAA